MQPKTNVTLDLDSFNRIKKSVKNMSASFRQSDRNIFFSTYLPQEIGLQLTSECNLRCKHCFEWNTSGYNHLIPNNAGKYLDIKIIKNILEETTTVKSNLFLWGGEPLIYNKLDELIDLLHVHNRWTVICTNGIFVYKLLDGLIKISKNVALLTSIEGFEKENDEIRGDGSFKKAMDGIKEVLYLIKLGEFKGKQSVHCTISNANVSSLFEFSLFCEKLGIDTLYLCFPWYISPSVAEKMDSFYNEHFTDNGSLKSWYSFSFKLNIDNIDILLNEMEKINGKSWNIRIRFQPAVELNEVHDFVIGTEMAAQRKTKCLAITNRMDVLSDGSVSACKLFREFIVGNLYENSMKEVWNGEKFNKFRCLLSSSLMPACSKCVLLYLNGI
jgi:MoaA/NifB/PqqE/SkfB family radical SAM enzyme